MTENLICTRYYYAMTTISLLIAVLQSISVSLGVGSSTLAITNFFVAIADGTIDAQERRMMGVVYIVLRVAMVLILITTVALVAISTTTTPYQELPAATYAQLLVIFVLFANALLMTAHIMSSTLGPAFQAGSWYTLGVIIALQGLGVTSYSFFQFLLCYIAALFLAVGIVNGVMAILKARSHT